MRPSYKKPYYFIHNINKSVEDAYNNSSAIHYNNPTNPISTDASSLTSIRINGTDSVGELTNTINNGSITINNESTFLPRNMVVTDVNNGLMSKDDKIKLDGIEANANKYIHPTTHDAIMIV